MTIKWPNYTANSAALGLNAPAVLLQRSRRGHDGSPGDARALGCGRGCSELAGLPRWDHSAPLLQQKVQPRRPGGRIRHYWYRLSINNDNRGSEGR